MPNIYIKPPDNGLEFVNGLPQEIIDPSIDLILDRCKKAFSAELELVAIPSQFDSDFINVPFIGVAWFKRVKWENLPNATPKPRNCLIVVSNIGLNSQLILKELEPQLRHLGGDLQILDTETFGSKRFKLYRALCQTAYYRRMIPQESNGVRMRQLKRQLQQKMLYINRWQADTNLLGIKVRGGDFLYALKRE